MRARNVGDGRLDLADSAIIARISSADYDRCMLATNHHYPIMSDSGVPNGAWGKLCSSPSCGPEVVGNEKLAWEEATR